MGSYDTVIDEAGEISRELQIKCFGKGYRTIRVGDAVVLHKRLRDTAEAQLNLEIIEFQRRGSAEALAALPPDASEVDRFAASLSPGCHPRFGELLNGVPTGMTDFQVAVSDGSYFTVRAGVLINTYDIRDEATVCVNWRGDEWDGDPRSALQAPTTSIE